jgi:DEAD_2
MPLSSHVFNQRLARHRAATQQQDAALQHDTQSLVAVQVIFASRTHSQLSQFVGELRRTPFALSIASVALASRKVPARLPSLQRGLQIQPTSIGRS